jgi:hypothetical protein
MTHMDLDLQMRRLESRLPERLAAFFRWLRGPASRLVRIPAACVLIVGGVFGFLPVLGFWMVPLGLILIAQDVPALRAPLARFLAAGERGWQWLRARFGR